jgi:hypothetical protein
MSMMANQYYEVIDTLSIEKEGKTSMSNIQWWIKRVLEK